MVENYKQIRTLKAGINSFSSVYEIKDESSNKHYALKVIKGISTPLYDVVFQREVGALNKLRTCENIVRLEHFETYIDPDNGKCGRIFLEYIDGENLEQFDVVELSNQSKFQIIDKIINAVQIAHENNIIHRDINPKNIMITPDENIKLIDFGISKIKDMVNIDTLYQFATNRYAAPEVHNHNENATEQSDIYSLGAVIFYIFTGEEPPIADEFEEVLNNTGGIDIDLKSIIQKMIKKSLKERCSDIFEVRRSILKIFKRFNKSNRTFIFSISSGLIGHMKNLSLVPNNVGSNEFLNNNLYEEFLDGYLFIEHEGNENEIFKLYGIHCYFECFYDDQQEIFKVAKIHKLQPHSREEYKRKAMSVNGEIRFIFSSMRVPSNNNFELTVNVKDHKENYLSSLNVNNEYTKKFYAWHKFLEIMESEYKNSVLKLEYTSFKIENEYYIFSISEEDYYRIDDRESELAFIYEDESQKNKVFKIGDLENIFFENNQFYLKVNNDKRKKKGRLPKSGVIYEDFTKNLTLVYRERKALNAFNYEDYASSSNLKSIFSGIQSASYFKSSQPLKFFSNQLDSIQKRAVEKALNSRDLSLIQGPPGTGKTNVIIEIIRQIFEINQQGNVFKQNVLLVSQSHAAVDKMLEDLDNSSNDNSKVIRIGKDENLTQMVKQKYAVEYAQSRWVNQIVSNSNTFTENLINSMGINPKDFGEYFTTLMELNTYSEDKNNSLYAKMKSIIDNFDDTYEEQINTKELKWIMIQRDWVNRISGRNDIQQHFIKNSVIISGTCTGVLSNNAINDMTFDYVIIDEAAKATFPELLISIIRARKIIMVGDHKQLPPVLDKNLIDKNKNVFNESNLDSSTLYDSIFMKLFEHLPPENKHVLSTQYRMHPAIGTMISQVFYDNAISNGVGLSDRNHPIEQYKDMAIVWIDTSNCADRYEEHVSTSFSNSFEANIVKEQLKIIDDGIKGSTSMDVGVITPYSAQKNLILKEIQPINYKSLNEKVVVNTVDAFQGGQKDIIIYSTVRSSYKSKSIGHVKSRERLNVAFSRAKRLLIIVGDSQFLDNIAIEDNLFPKVIKYIKENKQHCQIIDYHKLKIGEMG